MRIFKQFHPIKVKGSEQDTVKKEKIKFWQWRSALQKIIEQMEKDGKKLDKQISRQKCKTNGYI